MGAVLADAGVLLAALGVGFMSVVSVVVLSMADLALSVADGEVRTKVPVSLRGTAFWLASAAVAGETPTASGVEDGVMVGAGVCAKAPAVASAKMAPKGISFE